jgi:CDP-diacylglycerol--glycerol-3-phosphate 3-phosphatidyltransferase
MISIYQLKPRFQALLRPRVIQLHARGVTANQVTLFAAVVSVLLGLFLAFQGNHQWLFILVPLWMIARMALNAIDGMLAREFGQQSRLGAYLNELCDVVADAALYLPFAVVLGVADGWVIAVVLLATICEYAGVLGLMVGATRRYDGPMGKSDRAFCFGVLGLAVAIGLPAFLLNLLLIVVAVLLVVTIFNRVQRGLAEAAQLNP